MQCKICDVCTDEDKDILIELKHNQVLKKFVLNNMNMKPNQKKQPLEVKERIPLDEVVKKIKMDEKYKKLFQEQEKEFE